MKHRVIITNNEEKVQRKTFKVDDILEKKNKESTECQQSSNGFMTLTFLGYYEKKGIIKALILNPGKTNTVS